MYFGCTLCCSVFSPGLFNIWQQSEASTMYSTCCVWVDLTLCCCFIFSTHQCDTGRHEGRSLGFHQLSPLKIFGRKSFRMRSLFVRSAGSSLFCKTHMRKSYWAEVTYALVCLSSHLSNLNVLPCWVVWGLHGPRAAGEHFADFHP